jgi:hypothetical protein
MTAVTERYSPVVVGVNATVSSLSVNSLGGFLCVTSGVISLANVSVLQGVSEALTLFTNFPVQAGVYYPLPFRVNGGYSLTAGGGASGVLGVV